MPISPNDRLIFNAAEALNQEVERVSKALNSIPGVGSGAMGLTPDAVRTSPEYRRAKTAYDKAFKELQNFNRMYRKELKRRPRHWETKAGVTFDAFKGWAKSKQRSYLDEHPDSTFFDKLGITDRQKRETKKEEKRHKKLVKDSNFQLKYDPSKKKEVKEKLKESEEHLKETRKKNFKLSFSDRRKLLKKVKQQHDEAVKLKHKAKRKLLLTYNKEKRDLVKDYITKIDNVLEKLAKKRQQIINAQ